jgi:hypothetical protein
MTSNIPIRHVEPSQDADALQKVARDVSKILTANEEILYIATQNVTAMSIKKDSVVVTSNRIIGFSPGVLGRVSFHDYQWQDVLDVSMKQGFLSTEIVIETASGKHEVGAIDKEQAKRLYGIAQQMEQEWREKRRIREMEQDRAKSGGIYMGQPGTAPGPAADAGVPREDAMTKLARAKAMLDQNLISETEYEALKAKVLAEF